MMSIILMICSMITLLIMTSVHLIIRTEKTKESSSCSPIESGFVSTGSVCVFLSLQLFIILVLFLIFDLEVVFIVGFVLGETWSKMTGMVFIFFIVGTLWMEWGWGKLSWAL